MISAKVEAKITEALKEFDPVRWVSSTLDVTIEGVRYMVAIETDDGLHQNKHCPHCNLNRMRKE